MALKILSLSLHPRPGAQLRGTARIDLTSGDCAADDPVDLHDRQLIGSGTLRGRPCVSVALRRFTVAVGDIGQGSVNDVDFNLDHAFEPEAAETPSHLVVTWELTHRIQQGTTVYLRQEGVREISVLLIGEV